MIDTFPRLTVARKLMFGNLIIIGIALLSASVAYLWLQSSYQRQNLSHAMTSQARLIAYTSTAPLSFRDTIAATESLSAAHSVREVMSAILLDRENKVFAQYHSQQEETNRASFVDKACPVSFFLLGMVLGKNLVFPVQQNSGHHFPDRMRRGEAFGGGNRIPEA